MASLRRQIDFDRKKERIITERGFTIIQFIGSRQNTIINLALDEKNQNYVVLKEIYVNSQEQIESALNEIRILASLNSEFVAKYINSFAIDNKVIFIVQEYVEGVDLFKRIRGNRYQKLTDFQIEKIFIQVLKGLHYIHSVNIIHGDVRLESIVLLETNSQFQCKFVSFEYSRFAGDRQIPKQNLLMTAPEALQDGDMNFKSDIWQLGCLYYELYEKSHPFQHNSEIKIIESIQSGKFKELQYFQLNQILKLLLNPIPEQRPECVEILDIFYDIQLGYRPGNLRKKNPIYYSLDQQSLEQSLYDFNNGNRLRTHQSETNINQQKIEIPNFVSPRMVINPIIIIPQIQVNRSNPLFIIRIQRR